MPKPKARPHRPAAPVKAGAVPLEALAQSFPRIPLPIQPPYPPAEAKSVAEIPSGPGWLYEPKWDGFCCLVFRHNNQVLMQSKAGSGWAGISPSWSPPCAIGLVVSLLRWRNRYLFRWHCRLTTCCSAFILPSRASASCQPKPGLRRSLPPRQEVPPLASRQEAARLHFRAIETKCRRRQGKEEGNVPPRIRGLMQFQ